MAEAPYLMGIDLGTGGVRVGLFDRQGSPAVFHAVELTTRHPRPGRAEQDPGEWWSCLTRATRGALTESGVPADENIHQPLEVVPDHALDRIDQDERAEEDQAGSENQTKRVEGG